MIRAFDELKRGELTPTGAPTLRLTREERQEVADMFRADEGAPVLLTPFGHIAFVDGAWRPLLWRRYVDAG